MKKCGESCKIKDDSEPSHLCSGCGSCLFEVGFSQVKNDLFPLFRCKECGTVNFWD